MNSPDTTAQSPSTGPDGTDELPALDVAAYEAATLERDSAASQQPPPEAAQPAPAVPPDADLMLEVERWIVQKTEQLRAQQTALRVAQRERNAGVARADALTRELGATSANLEALKERARNLEQQLAQEREQARRRGSSLDQAQQEASRLAQELSGARAAEARQNAELASSAALLAQRSEALESLQASHAALLADQQRAAAQLAELEQRLQASGARAGEVQRALEAETRTRAELSRHVQDQARMREQVTAEREQLRAQFATCLERLQNREAYRTMCEGTIQELDEELGGAARRAQEQEARAHRLGAELEQCQRRLEAALAERDEARRLHDVARQTMERDAAQQERAGLQDRLVQLTAKHAGVCAEVLALQASLIGTERRAQAEADANRAAAERVTQLEVDINSRQSELEHARLELSRSQAALEELGGALERTQVTVAEQSRLLEERERAARASAASHAELVALIAALRGQVEELTGRLAAPSPERRALEERIAALTNEAGESAARVVRAEAMNAQLRHTVRQLHASLSERDADLQRATRIASTSAYALERVQSSINKLGEGVTGAGAVSAETKASILTRIDGRRNHSFVLRARTTIGRDPDNDVSLALSSVSRHHAVLIPAFRGAFLQDLGSTNGVLVNRRRVRCARLEHGDVITLGEAQLRYTVAAAPQTGVSSSHSASQRRAQR